MCRKNKTTYTSWISLLREPARSLFSDFVLVNFSFRNDSLNEFFNDNVFDFGEMLPIIAKLSEKKNYKI